MRSVRRWAMAGVGSAAAGVLLAAAAWACVSGPVVNLSTINAQAGQEIGVTGTGFRPTDQLLVRFNSLDGPVLATVAAPIAGGNLDTKVTVPAGTKPGSYVLVLTQQSANGQLSLVPVRAALSVVGDAGSSPVLGAQGSAVDTAQRVNGLAKSNQSIGGGTLALVALGVGGIGMFLAGIAALFAGRRSSAPEAARVRS